MAEPARKYSGRIKRTVPPPAEAERGTANDRGYTYRWQCARVVYLKANPLCVACLKTGRPRSATVVDHIVPHRGDEDLFWDSANWQALCKYHHDSKTGKGL